MTLPMLRLADPDACDPEGISNAIRALNIAVQKLYGILEGILTYNADGSIARDAAGDPVRTPMFYGPDTFGVEWPGQQAATADVKDVIVAFGLMLDEGASPLNLDGGTLTAGSVSASSVVSDSVLSPEYVVDDTSAAGGIVTLNGATGYGMVFGGAADKISVLGNTPMTKGVATADIKAVIVDFGLMEGGGAAPLDLGDGTLTAAWVEGTEILTPDLWMDDEIFDDVAVIHTGVTWGTKIGADGELVAFLGASPVGRQADTTDLKNVLVVFGFLDPAGATPLDLNGGDITAGNLNISDWDEAYTKVTSGANPGHTHTAYSETSHTHASLYTPLAHKTTEDALNGLVKVNGAGTYSAVTDSSTNWNSAYTLVTSGSDPGHTHTGSIEEADPVFTAHVAYTITQEMMDAWTAGSDPEEDPVFLASPAYGITSGDIDNWNAGSDPEEDPIFIASPAYGITSGNIGNWDTAYGWGDHSGLVPYTGATASLDLGGHYLMAKQITMNQATSVCYFESGTSYGTMFGANSGHKQSWFGKPPIIQQADTVDLKHMLQNYGFVAPGDNATPLDLNSGALACGNFGMGGVTPAARQGATQDLKVVLVTMGMIVGGGAAPLNLGTGTLSASCINVTGDGSVLLPSYGTVYWGAYGTEGTFRAIRGSAGYLNVEYRGSSGYNSAFVIRYDGEAAAKGICLSGEGAFTNVIRHSGGAGIVICSSTSEKLAFFGGTPRGRFNFGTWPIGTLTGNYANDYVGLNTVINKIGNFVIYHNLAFHT